MYSAIRRIKTQRGCREITRNHPPRVTESSHQRCQVRRQARATPAGARSVHTSLPGRCAVAVLQVAAGGTECHGLPSVQDAKDGDSRGLAERYARSVLPLLHYTSFACTYYYSAEQKPRWVPDLRRRACVRRSQKAHARTYTYVPRPRRFAFASVTYLLLYR